MKISWDVSLVVLSFLLATFGSFVSLSQAQRMQKTIGNAQWFWMVSGGITLGIAIWAMHFIGMLAFHLPIPVSYDVALTLLSIFPAIAATLLGFFLLRNMVDNLTLIAVGGVFMGCGIAAMHYIGMAALRMQPAIHYDPVVVALSVIIAIIAAIGALFIIYSFETARTHPIAYQIVGSILMGLAITGMHYTAMLGIEFAPGSICMGGSGKIPSSQLVIMITFGVLLLFGGSMIVAIIDQWFANQKSEKIAAEHKLLKTVINSIPDLIFFKDHSSVFVGCNKAFEQYFAVSEALIIGKMDSDFVNAEKAKISLASDLEVFQSGHPSVSEEWINYPDGRKVLLETHKIPFQMSQSEIGLIGISHDITARKQTEENLIAAKQHAESMAEAKSNFLATMSHEIRTPMHAIIGFSQLGLTESSPEVLRDFHGIIHNASNNLLGIINDILDYSKIDSDKLEVENAAFSLNKIIADVKAVSEIAANSKSIQLIFEVPSKIPDSLIGDSLRLRQILTNLLSNAIKFTAHGSVRLSLELLKRERNKIMLKFSITDTGIGMTEEEQSGLFQAFSQADSSMSRKFGGTGLGLAISQRLAKMLGGLITVNSEPGKGSTFCFTLALEVGEENPSIEGKV